MSFRSALYSGIVIHRRFGVKPHALRYRMMMALLDLDEIDMLDEKLRFFSRGRFNLFSFHETDHGIGTAAQRAAGPRLKTRIEALLQEAGIAIPGGTIALLALPRLLGFAFNPLSTYFCRRADGTLAAILYEVRNTFGERHSYLIPVEAGATNPIEQSCAKVFYVSPFMDMDMAYDFRIVPPGDTVAIGVDGLQGGRRIIAASFAAKRQALSDRALLAGFLGHPFVALAVVAGIHWEALKLWLKGLKLRARPQPPLEPVSIVIAKEQKSNVPG